MTVDLAPAEQPAPREPIVAALRGQRMDTFAEVSPFAACLMPLLTAAGWRGTLRQVADALPHSADGFDLIDLRNTLATLGYDTIPQTTRTDAIDPRLLPCLFVTGDGAPQVIVRRRGDELLVFDGADSRMEWVTAARIPGTAYLMSHADADTGQDRRDAMGEAPWSRAFLRRFRSVAVAMLVYGVALGIAMPAAGLLAMALVDGYAGPGGIDAMALVIGVAAALLIEFAIRLARVSLLARAAGRVDYLVSTAAMDRVLSLSPAFVEPSPVGAQLRRLKDFDALRCVLSGPLLPAAGDLPAAVICLAALGVLFAPGLAAVLAAAVLLLVMIRLRSVADRRRLDETRRTRRSIYAFVLEALASIGSVKAGGADETWRERYRETAVAGGMSALSAMRQGALISALGTAILLLGVTGCLALATAAWREGGLTPGEGLAAVWLAVRGLAPLRSINAAWPDLQEARAALAGLDQLMALPEERRRAPTSWPQRTWRGAVQCDRLQFRYSADTPTALAGVTLAIEPGEMLAVLGSTGAGKSTLLKLIAGLHAPQAGAVSIDGIDLRQLDPVTLRQTVSYLPQVVHLFNGTIAENLRLADPIASDDRLVFACAEAGVLHDVLALPLGFDTVVGDGGRVRLPGGLARKLALARTLVREAPVVLLDEPVTDLDPVADDALAERLTALAGRTTVVMVTQRPSHARLASRAVVLDRGRLRFVGAPDEALAVLQE